MVRHRLPVAEPQELPQGQAVGAAPLQPALAIDALEVADQMGWTTPDGIDVPRCGLSKTRNGSRPR
jgi:hypothetical protein